jgi:hypothetical protein
MPEFMDVHRGMEGIAPDGLLDAHLADLTIQQDEAVDFKHDAGADPDTGLAWCLSEPSTEEAVMKIHERDGHPTDEVYPVPVQA